MRLMRHGSQWTYRAGCRCSECRRAQRDMTRRYRLRKRGLLPPWEPSTRTHGTISCYNKGCRCEPCKVAARDAQRRHRAAKRTGNAVCSECGARFPTLAGRNQHRTRLHGAERAA